MKKNSLLCKCLECGDSFYRRESHIYKKAFCSNQCYLAYKKVKSPSGSKATNWKGGTITIRGYKYKYAPNHPNATQKGYVFEHRLVIEKKLGRYLKPEEEVHHINKDRSDNRLNNLELMKRGEHQRMHKMNGRINAWARDYDACLKCKRTDRRHNAKGLCVACDANRRYHNKCKEYKP